MLTEVCYKHYVKTGELVEEITFENFVRLYVNHRPAFRIGARQISEAFRTFVEEDAEEEVSTLTRERFVRVLLGEAISGTQIKDSECSLSTNLLPIVAKTRLSSRFSFTFSRAIFRQSVNCERSARVSGAAPALRAAAVIRRLPVPPIGNVTSCLRMQTTVFASNNCQKNALCKDRNNKKSSLGFPRE